MPRRIMAMASLLTCACSSLLDAGDATFGDGELELSAPIYVKAPVPEVASHFGDAVAFDGSALVAAASFAHGQRGAEALQHAGATYVVREHGGAWDDIVELSFPNLDAGDGDIDPNELPEEAPNFLTAWPGRRVALSDKWVVVSLLGDDGPNNEFTDSGVVYVFDRAALTAPPVALRAENAGSGDLFGTGLAVSGDRIAIGAPGEGSGLSGASGSSLTEQMANNDAPKSGAVYVYAWKDGRFELDAYLKSPAPAAGDFFGTAVALDGDTLAVGAPAEDRAATATSQRRVANGAAYVFQRDASGWKLESALRPVASAVKTFFGTSVSLADSLLAIGAPSATGCIQNDALADADDLPSRRGAVYLVGKRDGAWNIEGSCRTFRELRGGNAFGYSVSLSDRHLVVGSPFDTSSKPDGTDATLHFAGAAYYFRRDDSGVETTPTFLKAPAIDADDVFAYSVAASSSGFVVAAPQESGAQTGPNADLKDNSAPGSGAVYLYTVKSGRASKTASAP